MSQKIIDLRSDTVTKPCEGMKRAMVRAELGDDVFGDDPTVLALQEHAAEILGKEAALFVPSGTMANQLALRAHTVPGDEVIVHSGCHILNYESGAAAALAGVQLRPLSSDDGSLPLDAVQGAIHQTDDPHYANTRLICFENTNNACGGTVLPEDNVRAVLSLAKDRGIKTHLDGARLFNAAVASEKAPQELAAGFDTISFCLSKGLGAPVGSLLVGDKVSIARAYRFRKMYGGGMRQAGVLAAAGLYALQNNITRLSDDHARAHRLAEAVSTLNGVTVSLDRVHTNLLYFSLSEGHALSVCDESGAPKIVREMSNLGILITGGPYRLRMVTHLGVDDAMIDEVINAFTRLFVDS